MLTLSLLARADDEVVGHIAFSPVTITGTRGTVPALGLAPMAVAPAWQSRGVGARLITQSLGRLRDAGHRAIVVLGHPDYYPRFGFTRASRLGLRWEHPAPDEAFTALELVPGALAGVDGLVRFCAEFAAVSWYSRPEVRRECSARIAESGAHGQHDRDPLISGRDGSRGRVVVDHS